MGLANLATGLAPDVIAVVGEATAIWERIGPMVAAIMAARALPSIPTRVVATDPKAQPRLRGAVTLVVQQHFGAPVVA
jgi:predicted NBD/HSP70 family sugar kinase